MNLYVSLSYIYDKDKKDSSVYALAIDTDSDKKFYGIITDEIDTKKIDDEAIIVPISLQRKEDERICSSDVCFYEGSTTFIKDKLSDWILSLGDELKQLVFDCNCFEAYYFIKLLYNDIFKIDIFHDTVNYNIKEFRYLIDINNVIFVNNIFAYKYKIESNLATTDDERKSIFEDYIVGKFSHLPFDHVINIKNLYNFIMNDREGEFKNGK